MVSVLLWGSLALFCAYVVNYYICFQRQLRSAKTTGIPYIIVPFYLYNRAWLTTHLIWIKLARRVLPSEYQGWIDFTAPQFTWERRIEPFERLGTDTFLTVSPGGIIVWTADPHVISQITTRRNDFPKPTHIYESINIFGKNVVSSEGAAWRHHRKSTSPPFTEKNNHIVWAETLDQTQAMLASWVGKDGKGNKTVDRIMDDTMRLSLHVISRAGFGRKLEWPTEDEGDKNQSDGSKIGNMKDDTDPGHSMSYTYSLHCFLENLLIVMLLPHWFLKRAPFELLRKSYESYVEWGNYMREMVSKKKREIETHSPQANQMDIMGQLVKGQMETKDAKGTIPPLSDSEILGNAFVIIVAGHETAANSVHFALLYLALHTASQRRLQKDLDGVFNGRPVSEWDYDRDLPGLFGGMTGAVLNEELRLVPPIFNLPKGTYHVPDQTLLVNGKNCTIPKDTYITVCIASVHRHPKYWPHGPPRDPAKPVHPLSNLDNDLEEFKPERWLLNHAEANEHESAADDGNVMPKETLEGGDELGVNASSDTASTLYRPLKGAYLPFSDGYRACLGRRFAQVEVLACLAVIFSRYSVELAVDKYANDAEVEAMGPQERRTIWDKAAADAMDLLLNGCSQIITLQMREGHVSLRFVPRGKERFDVGT